MWRGAAWASTLLGIIAMVNPSRPSREIMCTRDLAKRLASSQTVGVSAEVRGEAALMAGRRGGCLTRGRAVVRLRGGSNSTSMVILGDTSALDTQAIDGSVLPCQARRCRFTSMDLMNMDAGVEKVIQAQGAHQCSLCGAYPMHRCASCGSSAITHGALSSQDEEDSRWIAFFCRRCVDQAPDPPSLLIKLPPRWCLVCKRTAMYGPRGAPAKQATHCNRHRKDGEWDLVHRHCEYVDGCPKRPTFGDSTGSGKPQFCSLHKQPGQVDVRHPTCQQEGCTQQALCGVPGTPTPLFCSRHRPEGYANIVSPKCREPGCQRRPSFGEDASHVGGGGRGKPQYCIAHRREGDVNLVQLRCGVSDCRRSASFVAISRAAGGAKMWYCALHKAKGSKNVRATLCHYAMGCSKVASFGDPLARGTLFCSLHKASTHINLRKLRTQGTRGKHVATSKEKDKEGGSECDDEKTP